MSRTSLAGLLSWTVLCAAAGAVDAHAGTRPAVAPHVRALDARATQTIDAGLRRSATFRGLVEALDRSDLVVYVYTTPFLSPHVSGGLSFMGASASMRFVKIALDLDLTPDQAIYTLAHELQHALEVAGAPEVRTQVDFDAFYQHVDIGGALAGTFETRAAQMAGHQVRRELTVGPGTIRDPRR